MDNQPTRDDIIREWMRARDTLAQWKAYERQMRDMAISATFGQLSTDGGTVREDLGNGYSIKAVQALTYKTVGDEDALIAALEALGAASETGKQVEEGLLTWKPHVNKAMWDALDDATKAYLGAFIQADLQAPQLEVVGPEQS